MKQELLAFRLQTVGLGAVRCACRAVRVRYEAELEKQKAELRQSPAPDYQKIRAISQAGREDDCKGGKEKASSVEACEVDEV